jgi:hypothetical protein
MSLVKEYSFSTGTNIPWLSRYCKCKSLVDKSKLNRRIDILVGTLVGEKLGVYSEHFIFVSVVIELFPCFEELRW